MSNFYLNLEVRGLQRNFGAALTIFPSPPNQIPMKFTCIHSWASQLHHNDKPMIPIKSPHHCMDEGVSVRRLDGLLEAWGVSTPFYLRMNLDSFPGEAQICANLSH